MDNSFYECRLLTCPAWACTGRRSWPARPAARPRGAAGGGCRVGALPIELTADRLSSTTDRETVAEGDVRLRQGGLLIRADWLQLPAADRPRRRPRPCAHRARGRALPRRIGGALGEGLQRLVRGPRVRVPLLGTRGQASRIDFASRTRLSATDARYTSCPRPADGSDPEAEPDWQLLARRVTLDFDANEGRAEGGRLRFQGVSILALPRMSFPVTGARKTGWLPPTIGLDSRSGFELSVPWYWNIAPDRDLTLSPRIITRRGAGLDAEYRYLAADHAGQLQTEWLPDDRLAGRSRGLLGLRHQHELARWARCAWPACVCRTTIGGRTSRAPTAADAAPAGVVGASGPALRRRRAGIQRLCPAAALAGAAGRGRADRRALCAPAAARAERAQRGRPWRAAIAWGPLELSFRPRSTASSARTTTSPACARRAGAGMLWASWRCPGAGRAEHRAAAGLNAASYRTDEPMADGRTQASRLIPTLSLDAGLAFERETPAVVRPRVAADAGAAPAVGAHAVPAAGPAAQLRQLRQGLQPQLDLHHERLLRHRPRVRRPRADRRRDQPADRP
jgi:LPS-assembly protein